MPPRVDCQQAKTQEAPRAPTCSPWQCGDKWVEHVVALTYGWAGERQLRGIEQQCVLDLKKKGVIR